jgi:hypothetical protein
MILGDWLFRPEHRDTLTRHYAHVLGPYKEASAVTCRNNGSNSVVVGVRSPLRAIYLYRPAQSCTWELYIPVTAEIFSKTYLRVWDILGSKDKRLYSDARGIGRFAR